MGNVIDFCAYKQFREDVAKEMEEVEQVLDLEGVYEWLLNSEDYSPSNFTFTITTDDDL